MARGPSRSRTARVADEPQASPVALKEEVREALLAILREHDAPAGARASAARTLMEFFAEERAPGEKPAEEMSEAELNEEIRRLATAHSEDRREK